MPWCSTYKYKRFWSEKSLFVSLRHYRSSPSSALLLLNVDQVQAIKTMFQEHQQQQQPQQQQQQSNIQEDFWFRSSALPPQSPALQQPQFYTPTPYALNFHSQVTRIKYRVLYKLQKPLLFLFQQPTTIINTKTTTPLKVGLDGGSIVNDINSVMFDMRLQLPPSMHYLEIIKYVTDKSILHLEINDDDTMIWICKGDYITT